MRHEKNDPPFVEDDHKRLASLVGSKLKLTAFFHSCQGLVEKRTGARNMFVCLVEGEDRMSFPFIIDEKTRPDELQVLPRRGLTADLIASGDRWWLAEEPDLFERHSYIGARAADWVGVPLFDREGKAIGALVVQSYDESFRFKAEDVAFLEYAAILIALALQFHAVDREIAVRRIASLVEETTDLDRLYAGIHEIVSGLIPIAARSFIVARVDRSAGVFRPVYCVDERENFTLPWPLGSGISAYVVAGEGRTFAFEDGVTPVPEGYSILGQRPAFWLGVPIRLDGSILGIVISQSYDHEDNITHDDQVSLEEICPHIAHAIARTETFLRSLHGWRVH